jgi:predicted Zn-dependent protease
MQNSPVPNRMSSDSIYDELESTLKELTETEMGRRAFLASVPFLLSACATTSQTRYREGDNQGQAAALTVSEERRLTQEVLPKMRKDYPTLKNASLQRYISKLGNRLVAANNLNGRPYRYNFSVVDVPYVNAFALPAGTIFVTAPLIEMADTEAELIGVIGHEVGHVKARHTAERMFVAKKEQSKSWMYLVGGGVAGLGLGFGLGKLLCKPKDKKCMQKALELGAIGGAGAGFLIQRYAFMANSREDEMEADRIGFRTAVRTGYDKNYVGRFYEKLLKMEADSKKGQNKLMASVADAMSTHPPSQERVDQMKQMASQQKSSRKAKVSSPEFRQMKKLASQYARQARRRAKKKS